MTRSVTRGNRQGERGFTLIELLVVVVILGILSAVVVFAVRGAGDKGKAAAVATDARTLRTAQEAFCAKAGRYATTMEQLIGEEDAGDGSRYKFLSEASEYHALAAPPPPTGPCNGTGFEIICKDGSQPPNCGTTAGSTQPVGKWIASGDLPGDLPFYSDDWAMVAMDSGRVVMVGREARPTSYDAENRKWTASTALFPPPFTGLAAAIPGKPTVACPNCGKVLVQRYNSQFQWVLYDPEAETVTPVPPSTYDCIVGTSLIALADGRLLKAGCLNDYTPDWHRAEIFDPKVVVGSPWTVTPQVPFYGHGTPVLARLRDDRVLVVGGGDTRGVFPDENRRIPDGEKHTEVYDPDPDPGTGSWSAVASSSNDYLRNRTDRSVLLADGRVLVVGGSESPEGPGQVELYQPNGDFWTSLPTKSCDCELDQVQYWSTATLLRSGKVLVTGGVGDSYVMTKLTALFDPRTDTWARAADMPEAPTGHRATLLGGPGCAHRDCGKVLVAGGDRSFLFSEAG